MFPGLACLPNTKSPPIPTKCSAKHEMPTKTHEMLSKTRKAHQYLRNAQPNTKCPTIPTKCSAKHEMPNNTYEMLDQTRNAHQYPRNARPNAKCLTKPRPHPRPLSHRERGACFIKNKKPHQNPQKASAKHHTPKPPRCAQSRISTIKPCFQGSCVFSFWSGADDKIGIFSWYKNEWTSRWREFLLNVKSQELSEVERICENVSVLRVLKNI